MITVTYDPDQYELVRKVIDPQQLGALAAQAGVSIFSNPYVQNSVYWNAWISGFNQTRSAQMNSQNWVNRNQGMF